MRRVSAKEASALCASGYRYLDVRSEAEYAAGHPVGAFNVPFPGADFLRVVEARFGKDARLVVGCASGVRSKAAVEQLAAAGWIDVVDVRPGFAGVRNAFGQVTEAGWAAEGLPTELVTPGGSYAELKE